LRVRARHIAAALAAIVVGVAVAQEDAPELSFLEYLGSWPEGDDGWLAVATIEREPGTAGHKTADEESPQERETDEADEKDDT
jgi:hypothetical protein